MRSVFSIGLAAAALALSASGASAHVGFGATHSFSQGLMHPFIGLDHILAMVAVGVFAAQLGGRALWLVPASFVLMMVVGGSLGMAQIEVPYVEAVIATSVIVLGLAIALNASMPTAAAMALAGFFAIFHGQAHGAEMPIDAMSALYASGFVLGTAMLHLGGIGFGVSLRSLAESGAALRLSRVAGSLMAVAGIGILSGWA